MKTRKFRAVLAAAIVAVPATLMLTGSHKPPAIANQEQNVNLIARGKYLTTVAGCNDCHTPIKMTESGPAPDLTRLLSGHREGTDLPPPDLKPGPWFASTAGMTAWAGPWGISYAANLTPDHNTGLGIWTEEMFMKAMRSGKHMGSGRDILPPMPWQNVSAFTDGDLHAVFAYLKSIPPISNRVPEPVPPTGPHSFE